MEKASILIVEDEKIVAEDLKVTLEHLGYSVAGMASTGSDAIEKAKNAKPDLILMDINLKGDMDGIQAAKKISVQSSIPVVFLTAHANDDIIERAKNAQAFGYIVKPFEEKSLNSTIQLALQKRRDINNMLALEKDKTTELDLYDRKILYELDLDASIPASEIGRKLRLPKRTINYRIDRLVESGYVNKFYAIINATLLGYQYYRVFMKFNKPGLQIEKEIAEFIGNKSNCARLGVTAGEFNLFFYAFAKSDAEMRKFLEEFNRKFGAWLIERDISKVIRSSKFSQKFLLESKDYEKLSMSHETAGSYKADDVDKKILGLLSASARLKLVALAEKINVDWKVVRYRIKRMEKAGVIAAYTAGLNVPKLNREIVQIDFSLKDISAIPAITGFFNGTNACQFVHELLGKYDLSVELYITNDSMLDKILSDFKKAFSEQYIRYDVFHICRGEAVNSFKFS